MLTVQVAIKERALEHKINLESHFNAILEELYY